MTNPSSGIAVTVVIICIILLVAFFLFKKGMESLDRINKQGCPVVRLVEIER